MRAFIPGIHSAPRSFTASIAASIPPPPIRQFLCSITEPVLTLSRAMEFTAPAFPPSLKAPSSLSWVRREDDQVFGTASLNKQHVPGNGHLDDTTLQREQTAFWMARQIGLRRLTRRYYVFYVDGNRHGPLMEDAQVPGAEVIKEYWP